MKKLLPVLTLLMIAFAVPASASPPGAAVVQGGGTGTFGADLDDDGNVDGSQFGMGVTILETGAARGHFLCLMAGRSKILGLSLMSVEGEVTAGTLNADGSVTFSGTASVNLGNGQVFRGVGFSVTASPGGAGVGTMRLTVLDAFDGVPGDTNAGNGNYDLPVETVASGRIAIG
jgi:hypothetical protein